MLLSIEIIVLMEFTCQLQYSSYFNLITNIKYMMKFDIRVYTVIVNVFVLLFSKNGK